jgi:hypothetical protein
MTSINRCFESTFNTRPIKDKLIKHTKQLRDNPTYQNK